MTTKTVTIDEAGTTLTQLIAELEAGRVSEIVVARGQEPVAKLVPVQTMKELDILMRERRRRSNGSMKGKFELGPEFFEPLPKEELEAWGIE
ncbi:MAG TPA: antitoxin [Alphaproteobacteria bacterium]|nr:antitoxin [Alphaproteobacteria bacterium]HAJ46362.1 antitoxin [Alphaproteobacteria bacterium]